MNSDDIHVNYGSGGRIAKKLFWSTKKGKIALVAIIIIVVLILLQVFVNVPVSTVVQEPIYYAAGFSQELKASGDNNPEYPTMNHVVFPYSVIACQPDNKVETIFASIEPDAGEFWVFTNDPDEGWISYWNGDRN